MATYTDNYKLTKPTYAEQADIGVINSNMNKIDDIMHSSQVSLAPAYDKSQTYAEGDKVMYELLMYKCISPTTGEWDASKWERTTASESGGGGTAELDILGEASGAVASFADGASAGLAKCIADINPVQDLHGYSKPWAGGAGVNQWDEVWEVGAIGANSGQPASYSNRIRSVNFCPCSANTNYFAFIGFDVPLRVFWYKSDYSYISYSTGGAVVTSPADAAFFKVSTEGTTYGETYRNDIAVNNPSTVTTYSPYANICPISGHSSVTINVSPTNDTSQGVDTTIQLGDTYYSGTLNVVTGELTIDHVQYVFDGSEHIVNQNVGWGTNVLDNTIKPNINNTTMSDILCDIFSPETPAHVWNHTSDNIIGIAIESDNYKIRFYSSTFVGKTSSEIATEMTGHMLVYPLATPQTVQLTPQEVNSLLGQNNISADTGDIDIVYVKASAPIQPNPTGTPTATLKKLGIEGTVFEIPSGGGGSSSGINYSTTEQVIGTWIDGKTLYQKTFDLTAVQLTDNNWNNNILGTIGIRIKHYEGLFSIGQTEPITPYEYIRSSTQYFTSTLNDDASDINVRPNMNTGTLYAGIVTIQYTKITD